MVTACEKTPGLAHPDLVLLALSGKIPVRKTGASHFTGVLAIGYR